MINGHHGNIDALKGLDKKVQASKKGSKVFVFSYWHFLSRDFDHAGFVETSLMLLISQKVNMNKAQKGLVTDGLDKKEIKRLGKKATKSFPSVTKNGVWGDPTKSSKQEGRKIFSEIIENMNKKCQTCLTGHSPKLHQ